MPLIGSDVSSLRCRRIMTGIPRVIIESHKGLRNAFEGGDYSIHPFDGIPAIEEDTPRGAYLDSDPVLASPFRSLEELDLALLLDANFSFQFNELIAQRSRKGTRAVALIHDILTITNPEWFPGDPKQVRMLNRVFLQKTFASVDRVVVASNAVRDEIQALEWSHLPEISVIPLGSFPAKHFASATRENSDGSIRVLFVSTIEPRKGHADLIDAFESLRKSGVDIHLTFIGKFGWNVTSVADRIARHPEQGKTLHWLQNISDDELDSLHNEADLIVMPNLNEGFGLGVEESLARGVRVLAREIPVFTERRQPNLHFFNRDGSNLAERIVEVAKLPLEPYDPTRVRTMQEFSNDLAKLIKELV